MRLQNRPATYLVLGLAGIFPFFINGYVNSMIYQVPPLYWAFELLIWVLAPLAIFILVLRIPGAAPAQVGFHRSLFGRDSIALLVMVSLLFAPPCYWIYDALFDQIEELLPSQGLFQYTTIIPESGLSRYLVIGYFALSAGFVEEFLFRGMLYRAVAGLSRPNAIYLSLSPLLFGLIHWESGLANTLAAGIMGLLLAIAYLGFRNLWPLIAGHVFTDLLWFAQ